MLASTAVAHADLRVLLMSVFHLTGDQRWLSDPYRPARRTDSDSGDDGQAWLSDTAALRLRVVAAELIEMNIRPVIDDPGSALLLEMMQWCLGDDVAADDVAAVRAEVDFTTPSSTVGVEHLAEGRRHLAEVLPHYATWTRVVALHATLRST